MATHTAIGIDDGKSTNLMAATGPALSETPEGPDLTTEQEAQLWAEAQPLFEQLKQSPEETNVMWIPNIQGAAFVAGTAVAVVAASPVLAEDKYVFGVCQVSRPASGAEIRPVTDGGSYLFNYHGDDPRYKAGLSSGQFFAGAKVTLVKAPTHGKVVLVDDSHAIAWNWYHYTPQAGYVGQDRFVMQVDKNGVKVRIQYLIESMNADEPSIGYCDPETWKISGDNPNLANVLTVASQNLTFADLTGGAVGETLGTGANAQITLDDNAAGHGWYIDYTPYLNDEYLPTSNPLEWIAKPGSEAEGKMDLLTVLLHEYGHALGLDHSADSHDLMASTLLPGVRRLPSPEELGQVKRGQTTNSCP